MTDFKTDRLFWKLMRESAINDRCAQIILTDAGDLTNQLRKRAWLYADLACDFLDKAWEHFRSINPDYTDLRELLADPVHKKVFARPKA